jgi:hypothetical protein
MNRNTTDQAESSVGEQPREGRYADLTVGDGEYVIYDRENHQAWLQSTATIGVHDNR